MTQAAKKFYTPEEYFHKDENQHWGIEFYDSLEQTVKFKSIRFELPLVQIYRRVEFESI